MQVEETTTSATTTPLKPTRASFVRSLPLSMPVEEVIERGREAGIQLQPSDIHAARYYMRQQSRQEDASKPPSIAQQLMLGGTISSQRDDETAGLTKIAGVRNGVRRVVVAKPAPEVDQAPVAATTPAAATTTPTAAASSNGKRSRDKTPAREEKRARAEVAGVQVSRVQVSIDDVLKAVSVPTKGAKGRVARRVPSVDGALEEQLHNLVLRLGTQRAREVIEEIEETAQRAS